MNKQIAIVAFYFLIAAFAVSVPVLAETPIVNCNNFTQSDNLETTRRLIARLTHIKELALENLKKVAPEQVEHLDNSLEQVKQLLGENAQALLSDAANIWRSAAPPKAPLISPIQQR